jgi:hypothetical protein
LVAESVVCSLQLSAVVFEQKVPVAVPSRLTEVAWPLQVVGQQWADEPQWADGQPWADGLQWADAQELADGLLLKVGLRRLAPAVLQQLRRADDVVFALLIHCQCRVWFLKM